MKKVIKCPICLGSGELERANSPYVRMDVDVALVAKKLKKEGYSFRQIASLMGIRHPGSVLHLTKKT